MYALSLKCKGHHCKIDTLAAVWTVRWEKVRPVQSIPQFASHHVRLGHFCWWRKKLARLEGRKKTFGLMPEPKEMARGAGGAPQSSAKWKEWFHRYDSMNFSRMQADGSCHDPGHSASRKN